VMKNTIILLMLFTFTWGNDSFYTKTEDQKIISSDEHSALVLLKSPKGYKVIIGDCGGFIMQLSIADYVLQTAQISSVIEWRINKDKKIIGAIVRTYMPIYNEREGDFVKGKYSSILNVLFFEDEVKVLTTTTSNSKAREVIDLYYEKGK